MARSRGVNARQLALENLDDLTGCYDGAISNFGVLNCIRDLKGLSVRLGDLIRRHGYLALCAMGPLCLWETCHYLSRARPDQAFRRWSKHGSTCSMKIHVGYPSIQQIRLALKNEFELLSWAGIGLAVPPSYVSGLSSAAIRRLGNIDRHLAHQPLFRMFSDHRLLLFNRL